MWLITSVFDRKTEEFSGLFLAKTRGSAIREFQDAITSGQQTRIAQHPEDFFLAVLGEFDEETGTLLVDDPYHKIFEADEAFVQPDENDQFNNKQPDGSRHSKHLERIQQIDIEDAIKPEQEA